MNLQGDSPLLVPRTARHDKNTYASETPVTDGKRVYVYFSGADLFAFDFDGKPVWSKPMPIYKTGGAGTWGGAASAQWEERHPTGAPGDGHYTSQL